MDLSNSGTSMIPGPSPIDVVAMSPTGVPDEPPTPREPPPPRPDDDEDVPATPPTEPPPVPIQDPPAEPGGNAPQIVGP